MTQKRRCRMIRIVWEKPPLPHEKLMQSQVQTELYRRIPTYS
jgi:hypothetical protein